MGVGRTLLERAATEATAKGLYPILDVANQMQSAVALYERSGWVRAGEVSAEFAGGTSLEELVYLAPASLRPWHAA